MLTSNLRRNSWMASATLGFRNTGSLEKIQTLGASLDQYRSWDVAIEETRERRFLGRKGFPASGSCSRANSISDADRKRALGSAWSARATKSMSPWESPVATRSSGVGEGRCPAVRLRVIWASLMGSFPARHS